MLRNAVIAVALLVGCGDKDPGTPESGAHQSQPRSDDLAAPKDERLSQKSLEAIKKYIGPLRPWDETLALIVKAVGEPTLVEGDIHHWYVLDGKLCWELRVVRNKDQVASVRLKGFPKAIQSTFARCTAKPE